MREILNLSLRKQDPRAKVLMNFFTRNLKQSQSMVSYYHVSNPWSLFIKNAGI